MVAMAMWAAGMLSTARVSRKAAVCTPWLVLFMTVYLVSVELANYFSLEWVDFVVGAVMACSRTLSPFSRLVWKNLQGCDFHMVSR